MTAHAPWQAHVLTLFPEMFPGPLGCSLAGRALEDGIWSCRASDLREFGLGRHRAVDDAPFGGGAGMVMRPDVLSAALDTQSLPEGCPVIYPTPRGARLSQSHIRRYVAGPGVAVLCGRFEGVDERVLQARGIEEICLGDFVLSGGEIAALALLDACVRLLPGVMGAEESGIDESFSDGLLEYPHYTRPATWEGHAVPDVLLSGHHAAIAAWRSEQSRKATAERRPDLWAAYRMRHQASSTAGSASAEQGS